jgi:hypothetical protein
MEPGPNAAYGLNQKEVLEGRAAVASVKIGQTATTERGPPDHPKTCVQKGHNSRRKGLEGFWRLTGIMPADKVTAAWQSFCYTCTFLITNAIGWRSN